VWGEAERGRKEAEAEWAAGVRASRRGSVHVKVGWEGRGGWWIGCRWEEEGSMFLYWQGWEGGKG